MKICGWVSGGRNLFWVNWLAITGSALITQNTLAQILPDPTLGAESSVINSNVINNIPSDQIDGGARRGANLFHSFQEFNVQEGRGVYFTNPAGIERILTRITGGNISQIFGTLGVLGNADLFLINPRGIVFGPNSRLDLNGSFIGSTANSIKFANGIEFSATNPQAPPLLNINIPIGLQYGTNSGSIINQSTDGTGEPTLKVPIQQTLALVGGDVFLSGGTMKAPEGRIELGAVEDNSLVNLTPTNPGWALNYDGVQNFRDINLSQAAIVDTSGEAGGSIQVQARNLTLTEGAIINYINQGAKNGGDINIITSESIKLLTGNNPSFSGASGIATFTQGTGTTGNLTIRTRRLNIQDGGFIGTQSSREGKGGSVNVLATDSIELIGINPNNASSPSGLFAQAGDTGNGGDLTVETRQLIIRDGGIISSNTNGAGQAGNVTIKAAESVELMGTNPDPNYAGGIGAGVNTNATGNSGNLIIETKRLTVEGGGQIATSTFGAGNAGNTIIKASESIELIGAGANADLIRDSSGLFASAEEGSTGNVGELQITTGRLIVRDGARISADNFGPGLGGNLTINVGQLIIQNGGTVRAGSFADGPGGILNVNASDLVTVTGSGTLGGQAINSSLFTQAQAAGAAGSLNITTNNLRVTNSGEITVGSTGTGEAGSLAINAGSIQLDNFGKLLADSTAGLGNINIEVPDGLILRRNSQISTNSRGNDPGGNLTIRAATLAALENSDITANAQNSRGGEVIINSSGIFGTQFREQESPLTSDITASSALGAQFGGTVEINTPDVNPSSGLVELSTTVVDVEGLVAKNLCTQQNVARSSFVATGRGGLPPNPNEPIRNDVVAIDWVRREQGNRSIGKNSISPVASRPLSISNYQIQEAQGWMMSTDGKIILTVEAPKVTPHSAAFTTANCNVPLSR